MSNQRDTTTNIIHPHVSHLNETKFPSKHNKINNNFYETDLFAVHLMYFFIL